jgi:hypothetical protein
MDKIKESERKREEQEGKDRKGKGIIEKEMSIQGRKKRECEMGMKGI